MKKGLILVMTLALTLPAFAAVTFENTRKVDIEIWDSENGFWNSSTTWFHEVPLAALSPLGNITYATLTIEVEDFDVISDSVAIVLNGVTLGQLTSNEMVFSSTDYPSMLTAFEDSTPTTASIIFLHNNRFDLVDYKTVLTSKLYGEYTAMVVPAPGAILLAGIGTTLVGWLRRRKNSL